MSQRFSSKNWPTASPKSPPLFYPNKMIVRFSNFKRNEDYNLLGGKYFEPKEENPMIGWRGASRYYAEAFTAAPPGTLYPARAPA
ncbi:MAG: hypothetical protein SFV52_07050 [Saprospiraceae bacterium]|nr:hypothetical protein [Saprospiraceae bacterium]